MKPAIPILLILLCWLSSCVTSPEPDTAPPKPTFVPNSSTLDTLDHGIYADVDPTLNAIDLEWFADTTNATSGYHIFRSEDSLTDPNGLLLNRISIGEIESTNALLDPLPTTFRDTNNISVGATYWYQLQAFHRSPTNVVTNSPPTQVENATSYHFETRVTLLNPDGAVTLPASGLVFSWQDPENGGSFHIIVERLDQPQFVWSGLIHDFQSILSAEYPSSAVPLVRGADYRWRVKRVDLYGGSTSSWKTFSVAQ